MTTGGRWHDPRTPERHGHQPGADPSHGVPRQPYGSPGPSYGVPGEPYQPYGARSPRTAGPRSPTSRTASRGSGPRTRAGARSGTGGPAAPAKPGRDRYLDLLRSLALVRVVVYHLFGWAWLTVLFPSMGVMFALAGSLMARSLNRPALGVIKSRVRRLLPPLWAFSAVVLVLLFAGGWNPADDPDHGDTWGLLGLVNYLVPIGAPPFPGTSARRPGCWRTPGRCRPPGRCGTCAPTSGS